MLVIYKISIRLVDIVTMQVTTTQCGKFVKFACKKHLARHIAKLTLDLNQALHWNNVSALNQEITCHLSKVKNKYKMVYSYKVRKQMLVIYVGDIENVGDTHFTYGKSTKPPIIYSQIDTWPNYS